MPGKLTEGEGTGGPMSPSPALGFLLDPTWGTESAGAFMLGLDPTSSQPPPSPATPASPSPALESQPRFAPFVRTMKTPPGTEVTWASEVKRKFLPRIPKDPGTRATGSIRAILWPLGKHPLKPSGI